jgi:hypothetical protein
VSAPTMASQGSRSHRLQSRAPSVTSTASTRPAPRPATVSELNRSLDLSLSQLLAQNPDGAGGAGCSGEPPKRPRMTIPALRPRGNPVHVGQGPRPVAPDDELPAQLRPGDHRDAPDPALAGMDTEDEFNETESETDEPTKRLSRLRFKLPKTVRTRLSSSRRRLQDCQNEDLRAALLAYADVRTDEIKTCLSTIRSVFFSSRSYVPSSISLCHAMPHL